MINTGLEDKNITLFKILRYLQTVNFLSFFLISFSIALVVGIFPLLYYNNSNPTVQLPSIDQLPINSFSDKSSFAPIPIINGLKPAPKVPCNLKYRHFILHRSNINTTLMAILSSSFFGSNTILIDTSFNREALLSPEIRATGVSLIDPHTFIYFSQAMELIRRIAIEQDLDFYFFQHNDGIINQNISKSVLETICKFNSTKWSILFFRYDIFCSFNIRTLFSQKWDPYIYHYYSDLDYYKKLNIKPIYQSLNNVIHYNGGSITRKNRLTIEEFYGKYLFDKCSTRIYYKEKWENNDMIPFFNNYFSPEFYSEIVGAYKLLEYSFDGSYYFIFFIIFPWILFFIILIITILKFIFNNFLVKYQFLYFYFKKINFYYYLQLFCFLSLLFFSIFGFFLFIFNYFSNPTVQLPSIDQLPINSFSDKSSFAPIPIINGLKPAPKVPCNLKYRHFILHRSNINTTLMAILSSSFFGSNTILIDTSFNREALLSPEIRATGVSLIDPHTFIYFSQAMELIRRIAIEQDLDFYFFQDSNIIIDKSELNFVEICNNNSKWSIIFFHKLFFAINMKILKSLVWDPFILTDYTIYDFIYRVKKRGYNPIYSQFYSKNSNDHASDFSISEKTIEEYYGDFVFKKCSNQLYYRYKYGFFNNNNTPFENSRFGSFWNNIIVVIYWLDYSNLFIIFFVFFISFPWIFSCASVLFCRKSLNIKNNFKYQPLLNIDNEKLQ